MSKLGSLYIQLGKPEGELAGCCETAEWAADYIESLRQRLSEQAEAIDLQLHTNRRIVDLEQQLAAALAAIKVKNHKLEWLSVKCSKPLHRIRAKEALAIQPDDNALKAWLGEPVRYLYQIHNCYGVPVWIDNYPRYGETVLETLPLYAPKGMMK